MFEVHLVPSKGEQLAHPETMTIRDEQEGAIPVPMPPNLARDADELSYFARREVLTAAPIWEAPGKSPERLSRLRGGAEAFGLRKRVIFVMGSRTT